MPKTSHPRAALVSLMICMLAVVGIYIARSPIRNAAKIQRGDSATNVHKLLGQPDIVFKTTEELQSSSLQSMSYVFTDKSGRSDIEVDDLPPVDFRAEWFGYASAGHLVFYDSNGVTQVLWGGT